MYGDWLYERREFKESAFGEYSITDFGTYTQSNEVFRKAQQPDKAMIAYEKALEWQELFDLALQNQIHGDNLVSMGYRVAGRSSYYFHHITTNLTCTTEDLSSKKRYADAARVLLDYSQDVREATIALIHGNYFSEARRIVSYDMIGIQVAYINRRLLFILVQNLWRRSFIQVHLTPVLRLRKT